MNRQSIGLINETLFSVLPIQTGLLSESVSIFIHTVFVCVCVCGFFCFLFALLKQELKIIVNF